MICEQVSGTCKAVTKPIGMMPAPGAIDTKGLDISGEVMQTLFEVDKDRWLQEVASIKDYYATLGEKLPKEIWSKVEALEKRLRETN
jgi:phosphoenolpyruvate carboxykinase (GTP)